MTASPLVPVPELPAYFDDANVDVRQSPGGAELWQDREIISRVGRDAPALAAAILAAAGYENHRIVDLGEPLPNLSRGPGFWSAEPGEYEDRVSDEMRDADVLDRVRIDLAVLVTRSLTPSYEPAEVDAIARALSMSAPLNPDFPNGLPFEAYRADARAALGALAALRSER